ncbi:MAG TPA: helix-turn-helix domain-containing protein [Gemmatimonadales bacterium]|nr:helix-turn-helix domain-containing protein [Gemmatimonadales bacterium]
MTPAEVAGLLALARALPQGAAVSVPREWVIALLEDNSAAPAPSALPVADLTCREAGVVLGRSPSTIRSWCEAGTLEGYLFRSREWRIPAGALERFQQAERERGAAKRSSGGVTRLRSKTPDLSAWRRVS